MQSKTNAYWLDSKDLIVKVSEEWDAFALENSSPEMLSNNVLGLSIWNFVTGDQTRLWLNTLFGYERIHGKALMRPYRCDSPNEKRFMEMNVSMDGKLLGVRHSVIRVEKLSPPLNFEFSSVKRSGYRRRCSICNRTEMGEKWMEPGELLESEKKLISPIKVIYTVCQDCKLLLP